MAMVRRVGAHPSRLFCSTDRELPRRRHGAGLSDRPRVGPADDRRRETTALVSERLGLAGWSGIILLVAGVMLLSLRGGRELTRLNHKAVRFALFTAVTICAYSVVDGVGARRAGSANAYSVALFVGMGPVMVIYALASRGREVIPAMRRHWRLGLAGGTLQLGSYGIAIWAMTVAPIAIVAALRETSVLFGALIAIIILKEPLRASRVAAALLIVAGLTLIRLY